MVKSLLKKVKLRLQTQAVERRDEPRYARYRDSRGAVLPMYNIGAGRFYHRHWTNIDYPTDHYQAHQSAAPFLPWNALTLEPLPVADESAALLYTSHMIEHVSVEAVENMFCEAYRTLKPDGLFRVTCPDIDRIYQAAHLGRVDYFDWLAGILKRGPYAYPEDVEPVDFLVHEIAGKRSRFHRQGGESHQVELAELKRHFQEMDRESFLDWCCAPCQFDGDRPGFHMTWWTHDKLIKLLKKVGFSKVLISGYGGSLARPLQETWYFDKTHPVMSLYVEALK